VQNTFIQKAAHRIGEIDTWKVSLRQEESHSQHQGWSPDGDSKNEICLSCCSSVPPLQIQKLCHLIHTHSLPVQNLTS